MTTPRLANLAGRAVLDFGSAGSADVASASAGRFGPDPMSVLADWPAFSSWSESAAPDGSPLPEQLLGPPVPRPSQVFAIGLNYREHAAEAGYDPSGLPQVFTKFPTCLAGPITTVEVTSPRLDWEVELVVAIGRQGRQVKEEAAWDNVAGLMVGQDLSARDVQLNGPAAQWSLGKSFPRFGPVGPVLVPAWTLAERDDLGISCWLNDEVVQQARTAEMIWHVPELIARLSSVVTLLPGDLVFTGTPAGIGNRRDPPRYLGVGDVLVSEIEHVGRLVTSFAEPEP